MNYKTFKRSLLEVSTGRGKHKVNLAVLMSGPDVIMIVSGGERPHIGAVAVAVPRPSLKEAGKISSTSSVITLIGHKDDEIARPISEKMAENLNRVAVAVAGVHVEKASKEDIDLLLSNSTRCADKAINQLRKKLEEEEPHKSAVAKDLRMGAG